MGEFLSTRFRQDVAEVAQSPLSYLVWVLLIVILVLCGTALHHKYVVSWMDINLGVLSAGISLYALKIQQGISCGVVELSPAPWLNYKILPDDCWEGKDKQCCALLALWLL